MRLFRLSAARTECELKRLLISLLVLAAAALSCNLPQARPPAAPPITQTATATSTAEPSIVLTATPTADQSGQCAYVEARKTLPDLSKKFLESLKGAALPVTEARAEAYGENCVVADGTVLRFAAMETDFYVTLEVSDLADESAMGKQLGQVLDIIDRVPRAETGPNPGYIGVMFKAKGQVDNLWFTQTQADNLRAQGVKEAELYRALKNRP
jgi:hypothetical protein